jgi:hypothetical protein
MKKEFDLKKAVEVYKSAKKDAYLTVYGIPLDSLSEDELKAIIYYEKNKKQ